MGGRGAVAVRRGPDARRLRLRSRRGHAELLQRRDRPAGQRPLVHPRDRHHARGGQPVRGRRGRRRRRRGDERERRHRHDRRLEPEPRAVPGRRL